MESLSCVVVLRDVPCNTGLIELTSKPSVSLRDLYQKKLSGSSVKSIIGFSLKLIHCTLFSLAICTGRRINVLIISFRFVYRKTRIPSISNCFSFLFDNWPFRTLLRVQGE